MRSFDFDGTFEALTGNRPFPWQRELYRLFVAGTLPPSCDLPTGLGKTSIIPIWLIALAAAPKLPRRLMYVVNRRTVVDQATREAENLRKRLEEARETEGLLRELCDALERLCAVESDPPVVISTLRGQFADNREWSRDPARPAVVVGTVDMIGSRLLFSGYGCGFKTRPLHAGFLGWDSLVVHDEAHLEPAFQRLIEAIQIEQEREQPAFPRRGLRIMALTATSRGGTGSFGLSDADHKHPEVRKRIGARKAITLHPVADEKKLADRIAELALAHKDSGDAILVFVRSLADVEKVVQKLKKETENVEQLTGTLRGLERDRLVEKPVFQRFLPKSSRKPDAKPTEGTAYLVCTSAGEVGVNISADHLVCDLTPFDSMAQRFGRVNRFGLRGDTRIDVVYEEKPNPKGDKLDEARRLTLELLRELNGDASPAALGGLDAERREAAFTPAPTPLPTSDILFDAWALTTITDKLPGRPHVEPYLHGLSDWDPPETHVAWREEVGLLSDLFTEKQLAEFLDDYPLKPHELLRDRSDRVFTHLNAIAARRPDDPAWLLADDDTIEVFALKDLADSKWRDRINGRTIVLPEAAGGLRDGLLDGAAEPPGELDANHRRLDVSGHWFVDPAGKRPRRLRTRSDDAKPQQIPGMRLVREFDLRPESGESDGAEPNEVGQDDNQLVSKGRYWRWYVRPRSADDDGSKTATDPIPWQNHTDDVVKNATHVADALLTDSPDLRAALTLAAKFHDLGKKRVLWQRSIGNPDPTNWHAKSGRDWKPLDITEYRHEFGSLADVLKEPAFESLRDKPEFRDLILHLVAVHHGYGRPHFPPDNAFDPEPNGRAPAEIAAEVPQRYGRLQRRYGRWGLAWLESLLRAADYAASANPTSTAEGDS
jgi:CRISPR-associated endonuclease/helicase Cas3